MKTKLSEYAISAMDIILACYKTQTANQFNRTLCTVLELYAQKKEAEKSPSS